MNIQIFYQVMLHIFYVSLSIFLLAGAFFAAAFSSVFSKCGFMHAVLKLHNSL